MTARMFNYMYDFLLAARTNKETNTGLIEFFGRCREANITLSLFKCKLMYQRLIFLGYLFTPEDLKTNPEKVRAILDMRPPTEGIKSFLGFVQFNAQFIPNLAAITFPLNRLTQKKVHVFRHRNSSCLI